MLPRLSLVLGGASSGKSAVAERLTRIGSPPWLYVATAQAFDDEMRAKIEAHRAARGSEWQTVEAPFAPGTALERADPGASVLVDCTTLWLTNTLVSDGDLDAAESSFLDALDTARQRIVVVSNEVGAGIVPENALARKFRIAQGRLNQRIAARADLVVLVAAGLPLTLKGTLPEALA